MAGVSKGTVDRVLHKRGKVSQEAEASVTQVLQQIDYHPNPIARNLKTNKVYRICVVLPDPEEDLYWIPAYDGVNEASVEYKAFGLEVATYLYHPYNKSSFLNKCNQALLVHPDALLVAATNQKGFVDIMDQCNKNGILVAFFNNYIAAEKTHIYIGQDLYQSGRIAAQLLEKLVESGSKVAVIHIDKEPHMQLKEDGFRAFFEERKTAISIISKSFKTKKGDQIQQDIKSFLGAHNGIAGFFVTNSKSHIFLENTEDDLIVVGYDLLDQNIKLLKQGKIDFLIHQKPKRQAFLGVATIAEHFLFGKSISSQNLLPIEIITSENVMY